MMSYEAWRITFQSGEQAALAAYTETLRLHAMNEQLRAVITGLQSRIADLHALAESNTATIDRLLSEVKALRELADTQAAVIAAKNAEIAQMKGDYAGALVDDAELSGDVLATWAGA